MTVIFPVLWASACGEDAYGRFAEFAYKGVTQRMRWIASGTFQMGSPSNEAERDTDEVQHQVTLTEGYWLADTECTQALWKAVMGENPSKFAGDLLLPVENVSWGDCQTFLAKLNEAMPGLDLRLPSEAEWEYACRGGTTTPFSFGADITTDQVNYNGNYPYADGAKGIYREKAVPVKSLPANAWGLFEMCGNVFEWCMDEYAEYGSRPVVDPCRNPVASARYHVIRGGSWRDFAAHMRSAYRNGDERGRRFSILGFRFARGRKFP
jgi:sulfatase modifying factor 1